ncbi:hypothetical protein [Candidatus Nitrosocosmicus hydrocola]|uniref:hypothetical protein n=1 Tax=Candidatus Nitrosocosmicus hydrocola TaxID=1826872 RepID=UPI0011E5B6F0|nr:hypothetical protein [Candidatus Nitrosocosmicus hydrocola]
MEKSGIIVLFFVLLSAVLSTNALFASKGNESFVNQNMASADSNISSLVYDLNSSPFNISYADWTEKW